MILSPSFSPDVKEDLALWIEKLKHCNGEEAAFRLAYILTTYIYPNIESLEFEDFILPLIEELLPGTSGEDFIEEYLTLSSSAEVLEVKLGLTERALQTLKRSIRNMAHQVGEAQEAHLIAFQEKLRQFNLQRDRMNEAELTRLDSLHEEANLLATELQSAIETIKGLMGELSNRPVIQDLQNLLGGR